MIISFDFYVEAFTHAAGRPPDDHEYEQLMALHAHCQENRTKPTFVADWINAGNDPIPNPKHDATAAVMEKAIARGLPCTLFVGSATTSSFKATVYGVRDADDFEAHVRRILNQADTSLGRKVTADMVVCR